MPTKPPVPAALVLGALLWAGLAGVATWIPLVPGEAVPLRWLRKLGEHPVRGSLALGLLLLALRKAPGRSQTPLTGPKRGLGEGNGGYGSSADPAEATMALQVPLDHPLDNPGGRPQGP
jgi:hypothetical protein